jgi:WD40 repeat protein
VWDVATGKELARFEGHSKGVEGVAFTPDGRRVLTCGIEGDHTVRLWDAATAKELVRYDGHSDGPLCVAATGDGRFALSGAKDGTLRLWPLPR